MLEVLTVSIFNQERKIRIYLPENYYCSNKRYPVLYMHDGQNVFGAEEAIGGVSLDLHNHLDQSKSDLIVAAIDQNTEGEERIHEYCPWKHGDFSEQLLGYNSGSGGKGSDYADFIVDELKPIIDGKYKTMTDENYMAGISLGGLLSVYAGCKYPDVFKKVAGMSSAFYRNQEDIEKLADSTPPLGKIYLDCGTAEAGENRKISELFLESNKAVYERLKSSGCEVELRIVEGAGHNYTAFKDRIAGVMEFFLD
ncbi:alpha/beta hydrolase [Cytobacillus firmus]|uniref:Putative esterase n=1 Tax=Cytobacillus firmus DS1 TaxID=1307436 RepID=W7L6F0_CYTFI|nr:alpha/beta hydrolase-fold protein [Cytobacillus firmus]EWG10996.1 putative esterase [Cytobacillus firmus DS1]